MTYKVALDALAKDATIWDDTSSTLSSASTSAAGLTLTDDDFSWVGSSTGVSSTYYQLQYRLVALLSDGDRQTTHVADTLRNIKKAYEENEDAAEARYQGQWESR